MKIYRLTTRLNPPSCCIKWHLSFRLVQNKNITCLDTEIRFLDGDGLVVRNSQNVNIDAGPYDE